MIGDFFGGACIGSGSIHDVDEGDREGQWDTGFGNAGVLCHSLMFRTDSQGSSSVIGFAAGAKEFGRQRGAAARMSRKEQSPLLVVEA
jgi:hypothetical protein